jgi:predicted HTH transcriptional regulator
MSKLRVFVSSVQKELENERVAVAEIVWTDPFLTAHCEPVLYEYEPASPDKALEGCLKTLDGCQVYVVVIWTEYGHAEGGLAVTHREYRRAKADGLPILVFIKGTDEANRSEDLKKNLLAEVKTDGFKYKRFSNYRNLQTEVRAALALHLKEKHGIEPSSDENEIAAQTIEAASAFGKQRLTDVRRDSFNLDLARQLVSVADGTASTALTEDDIERGLLSRSLLWRDPESGASRAVAAGVVLLGNDPSMVFPQSRILADAFHGTEKTSKPDDQDDIREPMPLAIERALGFVQRNTRHPMRVLGLNRIRLDEYPVEALREALVNAVAHRQYELEGQKIMLTVFSDRVVIASPGLLPSPLTLEKIRNGDYRPCSRNPLIAQGLSFFHRIEERGSGFGRMHDEMLDHGLDPPRYAVNGGFFQVVLPGPGADLGRLRIRPNAVGQFVEPSVEAKLNDRQKQMAAMLIQGEELVSRRCEKEFGITRDTAARDFKLLVELNLAHKLGAGRSTRYRFGPES